MSATDNPRTLPCRPYGNTGIDLSVIGFGGLLLKQLEQAEADRLVCEAVERGVNYFEVAPSYGDAEERLGLALEPFRKDVFLACKTLERSRAGARTELSCSLERLRSDHLDHYQLHALGYKGQADLDEAFVKGGALDALQEAKKSGQVKYLGFSAHSEEAALAAMERYDFDSVLFPFNFVSWYRSGFGKAVLKRAQVGSVTCLAIKGLARQPWLENDPQRETSPCWYQPITDPREAQLALRFTLSLPVTTAVSSADKSLLRLAVDSVFPLQPLTPDEEQELRKLAADLNPIFPKAK